MSSNNKKPSNNAGRQTITAERLSLLCCVNSKNIPSVVEINRRRYRWVGIGWVDECEADGTETLVT